MSEKSLIKKVKLNYYLIVKKRKKGKLSNLVKEMHGMLCSS